MIWKCGKFEFDTVTPIIMGVLNLTPDSFSDGGEFTDPDSAIQHAMKMVEEGASIIDVGGESTRPGASEVAPEEEWRRIEGAVKTLASRGICVSVDTRHADVARAAVDAGASIINDVSGFRDPEMVRVAQGSDVGVVVMHMQGSPHTMQDSPEYEDVVREVAAYLKRQAETLEQAGVAHDRICVDPGPGFGKTYAQTIELMRNLHEIRHLGYPVMVAASRKAYVAKAHRIESANPKDRDAASAEEALWACELGASVVRTHNVALTVQALSQLRPYVILGLGSNIALVANEGEEQEGKIAQINLAVGSLCQLPDSQIIDMSSFYESEPAYYEEQEAFVNAVVLLRCGIPPLELLDYLHAIENTLGRVREIENGPRTIDIDILDYQLYSVESDKLTLPHADVVNRDFTVKPIEEILPNHVLANGEPIDKVPEHKRVGRARKL